MGVPPRPMVAQIIPASRMFRFLYRLFLAVSVTLVVAFFAFRITAAMRETAVVADLMLPESRMVETKHGAIHALEVGPEDGPSVLLVHGSVGWSGLWRDTMDFLADAGYRAIALDLPPMGLSERVPGLDYSRQAQGLRILAFVEALEIKPVIVAHSFGAGAAVEAMMLEPDDFLGGVIVAGALGLGADGEGQSLPAVLKPPVIREAAMASTVTNPYVSKFLVRHYVYQKASITDDVIDLLEYPFQRRGTTGALADWLPTLIVPPRNAVSSDPARYANIGLPVALIWGREDTTTPPAQAEALQKALADAPLFWLDDTGHIPQIETPEVFHQHLSAALDDIL